MQYDLFQIWNHRHLQFVKCPVITSEVTISSRLQIDEVQSVMDVTHHYAVRTGGKLGRLPFLDDPPSLHEDD